MGQEHASIAYFTFRLIVLLLIRKSISSLRRHIEKVHLCLCGSLHSLHFHVSIASSTDLWITCLLAYFLITCIFTFVNQSLEVFFKPGCLSIVVNWTSMLPPTKVTERLPWYHDDEHEHELTTNSAAHSPAALHKEAAGDLHLWEIEWDSISPDQNQPAGHGKEQHHNGQ